MSELRDVEKLFSSQNDETDEVVVIDPNGNVSSLPEANRKKAAGDNRRNNVLRDPRGEYMICLNRA